MCLRAFPVAVKDCTVLCRKNSLFPGDCDHCRIFPEFSYIRWACKQLKDNEMKVFLQNFLSPLSRRSVLGCLIMGLFTLKYQFLPWPVFFFFSVFDETNTNSRRISEKSLLGRGSDSIQQRHCSEYAYIDFSPCSFSYQFQMLLSYCHHFPGCKE